MSAGGVVTVDGAAHSNPTMKLYGFGYRNDRSQVQYGQASSRCDSAQASQAQLHAVHGGYFGEAQSNLHCLRPELNCYTNALLPLGYSVTSGKYFNLNQEMMAASAPRSAGGKLTGELLGSVLIMNYDSPARSPGPFCWTPSAVALGGGNELGTYFGASLESVDINKDGLDELIVGAPLECGTKISGEDCAGTEDSGCIYIYSRLASLFTWRSVHKYKNSDKYGFHFDFETVGKDVPKRKCVGICKENLLTRCLG